MTLSRQDRAFFQRAVRVNLGQADGVRSVTVADGMPLDFDSRRVRVSRPGAEFVTAHVTRVEDGFFDTLGIPIRRGRPITADDRDGRERVAVVSPALAERLFGSGETIGQPVAVSFAGADPQDLTVVGVTADFVSWQMGDDPGTAGAAGSASVSRVLLIARTDRTCRRPGGGPRSGVVLRRSIARSRLARWSSARTFDATAWAAF